MLRHSLFSATTLLLVLQHFHYAGRHVSVQCFGTPANVTTLLFRGQTRLCSILYCTFGYLLCQSPPHTRSDQIEGSEPVLGKHSLHFHFQSKPKKKKKKIQYKCEYIFNTKRISNTHLVYVKIYIKHFYGN